MGVLLAQRLTRCPRLLLGARLAASGRAAALRQLSNRLVGILHGCLKTGTVYNEHTAWSHHTQTAA